MSEFLNSIEKTKVVIQEAESIDILESLRKKLFGRKGYFNRQIKIVCTLPPKNRFKKYQLINNSKRDIEALLFKRKKILQAISVEKQISNEKLDVTLPGRRRVMLGGLHPITYIIDRIIFFFKNIGFSVVYGPEIEHSYYNFDSLNIPNNHPARNEQDTFWVDTKYLLRTQTSGVQIRIMKKKSLQFALSRLDVYIVEIMTNIIPLCSIKLKD